MKGTLLTASFVFVCLSSIGQVSLDMPLRFSGDVGVSGVSGLAPPEHGSALLHVETAILDKVRLAVATISGDTINLSIALIEAGSIDGTFLRFISPVAPNGQRWVAVNASTPRPLVRTDGEPVPRGQIVQGSMCEVMATSNSFILVSPALQGCPVGTIPVTDRSCISKNRVLGLNFFDAVDHCAIRGGTLCTWGEFVAACYLVGNQLNSMFSEWEWIDDTSNHTHVADQVARTSCMSQRSGGALVPIGSTRCCYRLR